MRCVIDHVRVHVLSAGFGSGMGMLSLCGSLNFYIWRMRLIEAKELSCSPTLARKKTENRFLFQTLTFLSTFFLLNCSNGRVCWKYCEWMLGSLALWLLQGCSNSLFTLCRDYHNYQILLWAILILLSMTKMYLCVILLSMTDKKIFISTFTNVFFCKNLEEESKQTR